MTAAGGGGGSGAGCGSESVAPQAADGVVGGLAAPEGSRSQAEGGGGGPAASVEVAYADVEDLEASLFSLQPGEVQVRCPGTRCLGLGKQRLAAPLGVEGGAASTAAT